MRTNLTLLSFGLAPFLVSAQSAPDWWADRGVTNGNPSDDYAVVNLGQLKHIAYAAYLEFNHVLPGGAGFDLDAVIDDWAANVATADDYAVANLGQVRAVALPFYQRLATFGLVDEFAGQPTLAVGETLDHYAVANIGQVKFLFSFDPATTDNDGDGLSTLWELAHGSNPRITDTDGDGVDDDEDFNPLDPTVTDPPAYNSGDTTAPLITLTAPSFAVAVP